MPCEIAVFDPGDGDATMAVVTSSFDAFVAPDYLPEGRDLFFRVTSARCPSGAVLPWSRG